MYYSWKKKLPLHKVTLLFVCRPGMHQELAYSGHKRKHGLKYQAVATPDGLVSHVYGPVEGRRHDSGMYYESGLDEQLQEIFDATKKVIYGDAAYCYKPYLWAPFAEAGRTPQKQHFNSVMSTVRESVEWSFAKINSLFAFTDYQKNQKIYLQPVAKYYLVACLMCNAHTCLYGSEIGIYFNCCPPTLEDYFWN
jgi:hypothetical protein